MSTNRPTSASNLRGGSQPARRPARIRRGRAHGGRWLTRQRVLWVEVPPRPRVHTEIRDRRVVRTRVRERFPRCGAAGGGQRRAPARRRMAWADGPHRCVEAPRRRASDGPDARPRR
jgi:hypothetical protein